MDNKLTCKSMALTDYYEELRKSSTLVSDKNRIKVIIDRYKEEENKEENKEKNKYKYFWEKI